MSDVETLKSQVAEWKNHLNARDLHSISTQIGQMLWRSAFYRAINESRRFLTADRDGRKRGNEPLHELLDHGYFVGNSVAVRRLLDKGSASGPRGVYSLSGLVRDIADHVGLMSRANVLAARGLEYDFEPIKRRAFDEARSKGSGAYFVSREGWQQAEYWHQTIDQLCGVAESSRDPSDTPDRTRLEALHQELEQRGRNVRDWVDKFVAHAATPESRQTLPHEHQSLSLAKLRIAERVVVRTANFISYSFVDGVNLGGVPIPQFDQFADLDQPFAERAAFPAMRVAWDEHCREIRTCENWSWDTPLVDLSDQLFDSEEDGTK
jgi:hypothetical protein